MDRLNNNQTLHTYSQKNSFALKNTTSSRIYSHISYRFVGINDILELDQWNHINTLDVEEVMH
jgi:hypothetical protein